MAKVRTGKLELGRICNLLEREQINVFPKEWDSCNSLEEVAVECILGKNILIVTRKNGDSMMVEVKDIFELADKMLGEKWDKQMKLFTDVDLDGYGCGVVATAIFGKLNVDIEYHRYNTLFDRLKEFFSDHDLHKGFYKIYLTDLNITEEQFLELKELADPNFDWDNRFVMVDHHVTSLPMNKYKFAHVLHETEDGFKPCGTSLFYDYCLNDSQYIVDKIPNLTKFVEEVRQWDTWDWTIKNNVNAKRLNTLSELYTAEEFIEKMVYRHNSKEVELITKEETFYLDMKQVEMEKHFKSKEKTIKEVQFEGHKIGLVFNTQFASELGNHLSKTFPEFDAIMLISMSGGVSLRTIHDHVDCSKLAKSLGGGGHPRASGFPMDNIKDWVAQHIEDRDWNE